MQWVELKWSTSPAHNELYLYSMDSHASVFVERFPMSMPLCVFRLVEMAAKSIQQELQKRVSQEDAWNNSAIDLVRASDVSYLAKLGYGMCCFLGREPSYLFPSASLFQFAFPPLSLVLI